MYEYACRAILNCYKSAEECGHFINGEYNEDELEETDYK
jgi:hypothetical protein